MKVKKFTVRILAALGALFLLLLIASCDDEEFDEERPREEADVTVEQDEHGGSAGEGHAAVETVSVGTDARSATVMVYMNGSDLETKAGEASTDIQEMLDSGIGKDVNVIIQTMGTKEWQEHDISSKTSQTYKIENGKLVLLRDSLGQLDCTTKDTLSEFIGYCGSNYPAERYLFLFWDHGGGPVYGFGYDEWQDEEDSLTIAEMASAFSEHSDIRFDIIGMDCCIMADLETCYALAPYCRYTLLSEDFESGLGWSYTGWMKKFEENPGISTPLLGKTIVDAVIEDNENEYGGDSACISLFNESTMKNLFSAWKAFAYRNEEALLEQNYSRKHLAKGRGMWGFFWDLWGDDGSDVTLSDYYISDILALVENIDNESDEAKSLTSALKAAVAYYGHTSDKNELTGMAVSLPYGDRDFYDKLKVVYGELDLDEEYIEWLGKFVSAKGNEDYYDYGGFEDSWGGWGPYESQYGCNISGGSCEYGYDYDTGDYYGCEDYEPDGFCDDWIYDCEEDIWYLYDDDTLYLYDEESDTLCYYDEEEDEIYYYDEDEDDWCLMDD